MVRVVVAALLSVGFVQLASAQDKPAEASSTSPAPDRWDGYYGGFNLGYADSPSNRIDVNKWNTGSGLGPIGNSLRISRTEAVPSGLHTEPSGLFGGIQGGRNWRMSPSWVFGVEADFQTGDVDKRDTRNGFFQKPPPFASSANANLSGKQDVKWFSTLRARPGVLVSDNFLLYGTGGLTYGRLHASTRLSETVCTPPICNVAGTGSETTNRVGWTAGAGFEWAMDRDWSIKAEYLYAHLGHVTYRDSLTRFGIVSVVNTKIDANFNTNLFRIGINYRFGN